MESYCFFCASGPGRWLALAATLLLVIFMGSASQGQAMTKWSSEVAGRGAVTLGCHAEQSGAMMHLEGMCAAMMAALTEATSAPVTRGQGGDNGLHLSLHLLRGTPAYLVARLDWQAAQDQRPTQGEQLSVGAVDAALNERSYDLFVRNVLSVSNPPLP